MAARRPHPKDTVARACADWGEAEVVRRAAGLVTGCVDRGLVDYLGPKPGDEWFSRPVDAYWPRVWGARVLLYAWQPDAAAAVVTGLSDEHWRVREMCGKVAALREIGEAAVPAVVLLDDENPRVRVAALRMLTVVGETEQVEPVLAALHDPETSVRIAAERAVSVLEKRLDRSFDGP